MTKLHESTSQKLTKSWMDGRSPQIHFLSSRVGDLIEGKTEKRKLVASLALRGGAVVGLLLKRYGNTG
jgi:hypothetical protein